MHPKMVRKKLPRRAVAPLQHDGTQGTVGGFGLRRFLRLMARAPRIGRFEAADQDVGRTVEISAASPRVPLHLH